MKFSAFAFNKRNISCQTLYSLKSNLIDHRYLLWGEASINKYLDILVKSQPQFILGLGIYSGNNDGKIRIETKCSNKFRNFNQGIKLEELEINPYLKPIEGSKFTTNIGSFYCNLVSYKISKAIKENKLNSKYTFLHIPRKMKLDLSSNTIDDMLDKLTVV